MPTVVVDDWSFERIELVRRVTGMSHAATVRSLLERLPDADAGAASPPPVSPRGPVGPSKQPVDPTGDEVKIYADYKGHHVEALFSPATKHLRITSGPLAGHPYDSPTAAAVAVVKALTPQRENPETNGRKFWRLSDTGRDLRSILGQRF